MYPKRIILSGNIYVKAKEELTPTAEDVSRFKHEVLPKLLMRGKRKVKYDDTAWGTADKPSVSFLSALSAGPWRIERTQKIFDKMYKVVGQRDLSTLIPEDIRSMGLPLKWQNDRMLNLVTYLRSTGQAMSDFARNLHGVPPAKALEILYKALGAKTRTKVIDLWARDSLCIDAMPIDRHVRRVCKFFNLPANEKYLISLSYKAGWKPRFVARLLVSFAFSGKAFTSKPKRGL